MNAIFEKFLELRDEMEMHMQKEEQILFPRIKELENAIENNKKSAAGIQIPIAVMEDEHGFARFERAFLSRTGKVKKRWVDRME